MKQYLCSNNKRKLNYGKIVFHAYKITHNAYCPFTFISGNNYNFSIDFRYFFVYDELISLSNIINKTVIFLIQWDLITLFLAFFYTIIHLE